MSMHDKLTEAVRLYDRLLDAQMARPAGAYGYGAAPAAGPPAGLQPPGSPDPFPRQHYAAHPQYYQQQYAPAPSEPHQHQQQYPAQPAYGYSHAGGASYDQQQQPQHHPQSPSATLNGSAAPSLYPSFPPAASLQHQEPQLTGVTSQHAYGAGAPPLSPSTSMHGAYNAPHQQTQMAPQRQQQQGYFAPPHEQQQQQAGQPHPGYPSATPTQQHNAATTPGAGPAAGLSHFEQLMSPSPSTSSHAPPLGSDRRASGALQEPTAGIGAHGQGQGQQQAAPAHAGSAPSSIDAPVANGKMFPSVPTNDFASPSSPWAQQHQQQQPYYQPQQQPQQQMVAEAPALIDL